MLAKFMRAVGFLILVTLLLVGAQYALAPESSDAPDDDGTRNVSTDENEANEEKVKEFRGELEEAVRIEIGQPIEGYEPQMFMQVFPNLLPEDFDRVEAQIGRYEYFNGTLTHELGEVDLVHSAAPAISENGIRTLLENVENRLGLRSDTDIDEIIKLLKAQDEEYNNPVACTMDAKQCPDGSFVGRTGPNCEFSACPRDETNGKVFTCPKYDVEGNEIREVCQLYNDEVCALVEVQCVTEPCDPVRETIMNSCIACNERSNVISYTMGACEL